MQSIWSCQVPPTFFSISSSDNLLIHGNLLPLRISRIISSTNVIARHLISSWLKLHRSCKYIFIIIIVRRECQFSEISRNQVRQSTMASGILSPLSQDQLSLINVNSLVRGNLEAPFPGDPLSPSVLFDNDVRCDQERDARCI